VNIPDIPIPDIPLPDLPPVGEVVNDVQKCLQSADLTSAACKKVLADVDLLTQLRKKCQKDKYVQNPVCVVVNTVPDVPLDDLGEVLGGVVGGVLGGLGGTPRGGVPPTGSPSPRALYGGTP
jgi:phospholipid/cholesterol/gamma-HCH transport system substrate-binding protein